MDKQVKYGGDEGTRPSWPRPAGQAGAESAKGPRPLVSRPFMGLLM